MIIILITEYYYPLKVLLEYTGLKYEFINTTTSNITFYFLLMALLKPKKLFCVRAYIQLICIFTITVL